jgi:hypothetical protein
MLANWRRDDEKMPQKRNARDQKRGTRYGVEEKSRQIRLGPQFWFLPSQLCQTLGYSLFSTCHIVLKVGKLQQMANKKCQTVEDALTIFLIKSYLKYGLF